MPQTAIPHRRITLRDIAACDLSRATVLRALRDSRLVHGTRARVQAEPARQGNAYPRGAANLSRRTSSRTVSADMLRGAAA